MRNVALFGLALAMATACATGETLESDEGASGFTDDSGVGFGDGGADGAGGGTATGGVATSGGAPSNGGAATSGGTPASSGGTTSGGASGDGGSESGGASGDGGSQAGGAQSAGGSGTSSGGAAAGGGSGCPAGQKECSGSCAPNNPGNGCDAPACTPCPAAPSDGYSTCASGSCSFECYLGYQKNAAGNGCEPEGGQGGSGQGGSGSAGAPTGCVVANCPSCGIDVGYQKCCNGNSCGCSIFGFGCN